MQKIIRTFEISFSETKMSSLFFLNSFPKYLDFFQQIWSSHFKSRINSIPIEKIKLFEFWNQDFWRNIFIDVKNIFFVNKKLVLFNKMKDSIEINHKIA